MSTLNDAMFNFFGASTAHALIEDRMFAADHFINLAAAQVYNIAFTTGDNIVGVSLFTLTARSEKVIIEFKEDSTYSAGTPWTFYNLNRALNNTITPFSDVVLGATEDVAGTVIRRATLLGSTDAKVATTTGGGGGFSLILKPQTVYILAVTNEDIQAADFNIQFVVGVGK